MASRSKDTSSNREQALRNRIGELESSLAEMRMRETFMFQGNPVPMWVFDLDTLRFLSVNDAAVSHYGYTREEFLAMSVLDIRPAEDHDAAIAASRKVSAYLPQFLGTWRHLRKSGEAIRVEAIGTDIEFGGRPARLVQLHDVTERERMLAELRDAEAEIRTLVEHAPYLISRFDRDLRYLYTSPATTGITGRQPAEIIGRTHRELGYPPGFCDYIQREYRLVFETGEARDVEFAFDTPSGRRYFFARAVPEKNERGEVGSIVTITHDITDRKIAEIALRESEARFRALTELSSDWYWEQDAEFRFTFVSESWYRITGTRPEDIIGRTRWEYSAGVEQQAQGSKLDALLAAHLSFRDVRIASRKPDGSLMIVETSGLPVFDEAGAFCGYRGVGRDITAREAGARSLRESEERFRAITELARDWYWEQDERFRFTFISPSAFDVMQAEFSEVIGRARWELPHLVHGDDFWRAHRQVLERHEPFHNLILQRVDDNGRVHLLSVSGAPFFDVDGRFRGYRGLTRDITAFEHARESAREFGGLLRRLAEALGQVLWISDPEFRKVFYVSSAFESMWKMPAATVYQDPLAWRGRVHPDDLPVVEEFRRQQARREPAQVEFRLLLGEGGVSWAWAQSFPFSDETGEPLVAGVVIDITHRRIEEERRLEEARKQRQALVREVHHRIKNNLQGVVGLLRMHASQDASMEPAMEAAISQVQAIATVHGIQAREGEVVLCHTLTEVAAMLERITRRRIRVEIDANVGTGILLAEGDAVAAALVLNELLMNAVKHGANVGPAEVTVARSNGGAIVRIVNAGALEAGFQYERGRGIGTGLELVKSLTPDKGMTVSIQSGGGRVTAELRLEDPVIRHG